MWKFPDIAHARVLYAAVRELIERGEFAQIRSLDAGLYQAIKTVGADELKGLATYVRGSVALDDFVRVA